MQVLRKLRRLSWKEHEPYLVHTMLGATKGRYDDLPYVAALCGGLSQYHPSLGVALADALLEEVCLLGELSHPQIWNYVWEPRTAPQPGRLCLGRAFSGPTLPTVVMLGSTRMATGMQMANHQCCCQLHPE